MDPQPAGDRIEPGGRPLLRGLLHQVAFPIVIAAAIVLVSLARGTRAAVACAIFGTTAALLFGVSAAYHRGRWTERARLRLKRFDHANIFLIIAGTYTPMCLLVLHGSTAAAVLAVVWGGALVGVLLSLFWPNAPRWLIVPVYLAVGWVAAFVVPELVHNGGVAIFVLIITGGALYSAGALVYGLRKPDPAPTVFGFHEIFHSCTIAAFTVHYVAVSFAAYRF